MGENSAIGSTLLTLGSLLQFFDRERISGEQEINMSEDGGLQEIKHLHFTLDGLSVFLDQTWSAFCLSNESSLLRAPENCNV